MLLLILGTLTILQAFGIAVTPSLATLEIGGLAVAKRFNDTFYNLFSGLYLIISGQVRTEDYIKLARGEKAMFMISLGAIPQSENCQTI